MVRDALIQACSFKHRKVRVDGQWLQADRGFDIKLLRVGQIYPLEIYQTLDGTFVIRGIKQ